MSRDRLTCPLKVVRAVVVTRRLRLPLLTRMVRVTSEANTFTINLTTGLPLPTWTLSLLEESSPPT